ncbi:hypothetical protein [Mobiluncus mulieris]|uniref:hypothetical protein n=1 Tax=Mobiluncus mulieris TaxID=2052 RepID=UPI00209241B9|nr:hypothetical protein [Mobiluncus mulieris]
MPRVAKVPRMARCQGCQGWQRCQGCQEWQRYQGSLQTGKTDSKTAAKTVGPTLQLKWHREPSLAPAWFMTIVGVLALLAVLAYITLSFISELRSKTRRAAAEEKDKTIRLAAEAVGKWKPHCIRAAANCAT